MLKMNPVWNPLRWKKSFLIALLAFFLVIWFGFFDTYSVWTRIQLEREKRSLLQKTEQLVHDTALLRERIEALENNPALLERIAREEYGMRKPGETIYRIRE